MEDHKTTNNTLKAGHLFPALTYDQVCLKIPGISVYNLDTVSFFFLHLCMHFFSFFSSFFFLVVAVHIQKCKEMQLYSSYMYTAGAFIEAL